MPEGGDPNTNSAKEDRARRNEKKRKAFTRMFEGITDQYLSDYGERGVDLSGEEETDDKTRPQKELPEPEPIQEAPKGKGLGSLFAAKPEQSESVKPKLSSLFESDDNLTPPQTPPEPESRPTPPPPSQPSDANSGARKKGLYTQLMAKPVLPDEPGAPHGSVTPTAAAPPPSPPGAIPSTPGPSAFRIPSAQDLPQPTAQAPPAPPTYPQTPPYPQAQSPPAPAYPQAPAQTYPQSPVEPTHTEPAARGSLPPAPKLGSPQRPPGQAPQPDFQQQQQQPRFQQQGYQQQSESPPNSQAPEPPRPAAQTRSPEANEPSRGPAPTAASSQGAVSKEGAAPGTQDPAQWQADFVKKFQTAPQPSKPQSPETPPPAQGKMHTAETAPVWGLETQMAVERLILSEGELPFEPAKDRRKKRKARQEEDFEMQTASGKYCAEFSKVGAKRGKVRALVTISNVLSTIATGILLYKCHEPGGSGLMLVGFLAWLPAAAVWLWALSMNFHGFKRLLRKPLMFFVPLAAAVSVTALTDVPELIAFQLCRPALEQKASELRTLGGHHPKFLPGNSVGRVGCFDICDYGVEVDGTVYLFTVDSPPKGFIMSAHEPPLTPFGVELKSKRIGEAWFSF